MLFTKCIKFVFHDDQWYRLKSLTAEETNSALSDKWVKLSLKIDADSEKNTKSQDWIYKLRSPVCFYCIVLATALWCCNDTEQAYHPPFAIARHTWRHSEILRKATRTCNIFFSETAKDCWSTLQGYWSRWRWSHSDGHLTGKPVKCVDFCYTQ